MNVATYVKRARATDRLDLKGEFSWVMPCLGLAGEIGSLLAELKKEVRDPVGAETTRLRVQEELGDILWYAVAITRRADLRFSTDILLKNLVKIQETGQAPAPTRKSELQPGKNVFEAIVKKGAEISKDFDLYQDVCIATSRYADLKHNRTLVPYLSRISKNASDILRTTEGAAGKFPTSKRHQVAEALGDIIWYVAGFAHLYDIKLSEVAKSNATKIRSAFEVPLARNKRSNSKFSPPLDSKAPEIERFPRRFRVDFVEKSDGTVVMLIDNVRVGAPLTDNSYEPDGYRFHDAIHLAFVAILGWSPVMRAVLMRKRKYDKKIDTADDGARAAIVEEMIVKLCHSYAVKIDPVKLLDQTDRVSLDLLKQVESLAEGLEVTGAQDAVPRNLWEWNIAIVEGLRVFNKLRNSQSGSLVINMDDHSIQYIRK